MILKVNKELEIINITKNHVVLKVVSAIFLVSAIASFTTVAVIKHNPKILHLSTVVHDTITEFVIFKLNKQGVKKMTTQSVCNFANNPGNLRPSSIQEIKDLSYDVIQTANNGEFLFFLKPEHGWKALRILIEKNYCDMTIRNAIFKYCPPTENENVDEYVAEVANMVHKPSKALVKTCNIDTFIMAIAKKEGYNNWNKINH